jgi:hypothetical protein
MALQYVLLPQPAGPITSWACFMFFRCQTCSLDHLRSSLHHHEIKIRFLSLTVAQIFSSVLFTHIFFSAQVVCKCIAVEARCSLAETDPTLMHGSSHLSALVRAVYDIVLETPVRRPAPTADVRQTLAVGRFFSSRSKNPDQDVVV